MVLLEQAGEVESGTGAGTGAHFGGQQVAVFPHVLLAGRQATEKGGHAASTEAS